MLVLSGSGEEKILGETSGYVWKDKETWWWNENVQDSVQRKKAAKKQWERMQHDKYREEYRERNKEVKRAVAQAREEACQEIYEGLESREGQDKVYSLARSRNKATKDINKMKQIKGEDGQVIRKQEDIQRRWKEYFEKLLNEENERLIREDVERAEVVKALARMKNGKVWKVLGEEGIDLLWDLFKKIYEQEVVPDEWRNSFVVPICILKIARVCPAYKSGQSDMIDNYRAISSLPVFSKIFERLTLNRMQCFISRFDILTPCQFGFRKGRNTSLAVIRLISHVVQAYHQKIYSACFFLDLKKAFDTVNHELLLQKLEHYGFRGQCSEYLYSYFRNRKQYVQVDGHDSSYKPVVSGVPQGSILGPLCFSLFINDMPLAVKEEAILFADDVAFVILGHSLVDLYKKIKDLFANLTRYLNMNKLIPNAKKSKLMMFRSRPTLDLPSFSFGGDEIQWVTEYEYLGITIADNLNYSKHIKNTALTISCITGTFSGLRQIVPREILIKLYYALVYPHLCNHITVWGSAPPSNLKILMVRTNNILRTILGVLWENNRPFTE